MNSGRVFRRMAFWVTSLVALLAFEAAFAQEPVVDPPGRVARLSLIEGEVSIAPTDSEEWAQAVLNRPLTSGDRLAVDGDGRAELQVGSASIHLDRDTSFGFIELDDDVMQMSLTEGAATIRVRRLAERETVQVETPNATVFLRHTGEYHLEIDSAADRTIVKARSGEAEVVGGSKTYRVRANEEEALEFDGFGADDESEVSIDDAADLDAQIEAEDDLEEYESLIDHVSEEEAPVAEKAVGEAEESAQGKVEEKVETGVGPAFIEPDFGDVLDDPIDADEDEDEGMTKSKK